MGNDFFSVTWVMVLSGTWIMVCHAFYHPFSLLIAHLELLCRGDVDSAVLSMSLPFPVCHLLYPFHSHCRPWTEHRHCTITFSWREEVLLVCKVRQIMARTKSLLSPADFVMLCTEGGGIYMYMYTGGGCSVMWV